MGVAMRWKEGVRVHSVRCMLGGGVGRGGDGWRRVGGKKKGRHGVEIDGWMGGRVAAPDFSGIPKRECNYF